MGARVRINLSLAETSEGRIVWSDRIERPFETLLDTLDEIVAHVAATVIGRLEEADIAAARRQRPESMSAYECHLRGLEFHRLGGVTNENLLEAVKWFDRAIEADPNFGRPYAMKVCAVAGLPNFDIYEGERVTHRALQLDPNDPEANRIMGSVQMAKGAFDASRRYHEKAMELSPNDAYIKGRSAAFYTFFGMPERALELLDKRKRWTRICLSGVSRSGALRSTRYNVITTRSSTCPRCPFRPGARGFIRSRRKWPWGKRKRPRSLLAWL